ncbi:MAG TPA: Ig-like domain-containing protein, partial [bacterium]|nr:Ig-like domain-containing protein [bacterium]
MKITLKASDKLGNTTENTWFYTINATGIAELSFTSPADMAWVDGEVKVNISAEDVWGGAGISKVDFYINNVLFGTSDEAEARFNWNSAETDETTGDWIYPQAEYLLKAVATDIADHEMETIISVTVDHTPPVMNDVTIGNNGWLSNNPDAILT